MKYKLFLLTVLASVGFFNYHALLPPNTIKLIFYLDVMLCFLAGLTDGVSLRGVHYPRVAFVVLLAGICISCIPATAFHSQSMLVSVMTTLPFIFSYAFFWILMKLDIPRDKIIKTYIVLCAVSTVVYFCNLATVPFNMFGEQIINEDISRGVIRLPVVFNEMFPLLVFYSINRWLLDKKKKWIFVVAWAIFMIFMCVTRQIIAATLVLGAWFFFRNISAIKKLLMVAMLAGVVVFVLPMIPMYRTMLELTEDQRDENDQEENIRITAWKYYTYENQTNSLTPFIGNGIPSIGNSRWGIIFDSDTEDNGCFAADVGWAGFFWYFGLPATAALLLIMLVAIFKRKPADRQYLTYWMIYIAITSATSGPIVYFNWTISITVVLYLIFKKDTDSPETLSEKPSETIPATPQRYPQLSAPDARRQ